MIRIREQSVPRRKYVIAAVEGRIDDCDCATFRTYLEKMRADRRIVFDFAKVSCLAADGRGTLMEVFRIITEAGGRMSIGNVPDKVLTLLNISRITEILGADATLSGAVKKLRRPRPSFKYKEPKPPTYFATPWVPANANMLHHGKCEGRFVWFGAQPRFCPCCGRSTKK